MGVKVKWNPRKRAWYVYVNHNRKRTSKAFGSDEKAAREAAREIAKSLKLGELALPEKRKECPTVRAFGDTWIEGSTTRKASTLRLYRLQAKNHVYPVLGDTRVDQVTREDVRALIKALRSGTLKSGSARSVFLTLSGIMTAAVEAGYLKSNPCGGLRKEIAKRDDERQLETVKALDRDQVAALLLGIRNAKRRDFTAIEGDTLYAFFLCMARTGMRLGEAAALQWSAVDFRKRQITIRRTLSHDQFTTPKSGRSRIVDMSQQLHDELKLHEKRCGDAAALSLVFQSAPGKPLDVKNIRTRVFTPVAKALGFGALTPHVLRHSYASQLLGDGESIHYVQTQLGHSLPSITLDVYGHFLPSGDQRAVNKLDADPAHPTRILQIAGSRQKRA